MNSKRRTAAVVAAWSTVAVIGIGSVGVAMAADNGSASPSTSASASASANPGGATGSTAAKKLHGLRARALHGEFVVQTKDGLKTVVLQKGSVTALSATSVTVKSTDGYTVTWTINDQTRVRKDKAAAAATDLKSGLVVRVVGPKDGSATTARVIVIGDLAGIGTPGA